MGATETRTTARPPVRSGDATSEASGGSPNRPSRAARMRSLAIDDDHIGLLARPQRAGPVLEAADVRAVDRRRLQNVAGCQHRVRRVDVRLPAFSVHSQTLRSEYGSHLREHVSGNSGHDVSAQARSKIEFTRPEARGAAVSHLKLHLRCDGDLPARIRD